MKRYLIIFVLALILDVILSLLRAFDGTWAVVIDSLCFFIFTFFLLRKYGHSSKSVFFVTISIILGMISLELPIRIIDFSETKATLVSSLIPSVSVVMSLIYFLYRKYIVLVIAILFLGGLVFIVRPKWHNFVVYGNLHDGINVSDQKIDTDSTSIYVQDVNKEFILLDFWSSRCGICFEKFPKLQQLYDDFKSDETIMITSVFITNDNESYFDGVNILHKYGYTFPVIGCTDWNSSLVSTLGINGVPTVIILNKNKDVVFRGNIESASKKLKSLIKG